MKIEYKTVGATIKQAGDDGTFEAVIATFGALDKDGDIVEPGAFGDAVVSVLPSHDSGSVPLGKTAIRESGLLAIAAGSFNLEVSAAKEWHSALKFDLDHPPAVQEWSWGFRPAEFRFEERDGEQVRVLSKVDLLEVSPVLRGASVGTRTISAKGEKDPPTLAEQVEAVAAEADKLLARLHEVAEGRKEKGRKLGQDAQLATIALAKRWVQINEQLTTLIKADMLPDDAVAQAAARFLHFEAARHLGG